MKRTASTMILVTGILYIILSCYLVIFVMLNVISDQSGLEATISIIFILTGLVKGIFAILNRKKLQHNPSISLGIIFIVLGVFSIAPFLSTFFVVGGILTIISANKSKEE